MGHSRSSSRREPVDRLLTPLQDFLRHEAAGGMVLMVCAAVALLCANSPWGDRYAALWQTKVGVDVAGKGLSKPLLLWINDGLMAVFFFVAGLEIKREIMVGELSSVRRALVPIAAAAGGMLLPAAIYALLNRGGPGARGWGIPMATDIAFAVGVLPFAGRGLPVAASVFLTSVAIADDIGATLVIALFYAGGVSGAALAAAGALFAAMCICNWAGVRAIVVYSLLGAGLWVAFLKSGLHPTASGVLAALAIPARSRINADEFVEVGRSWVERFASMGEHGQSILANPEQAAAVVALEETCHHAQTPLQRLEHLVHPWAAFAIIPVFALANAGVSFREAGQGGLVNATSMGIVGGLLVGKVSGVAGLAWLLVRAGLAEMPEGLTWRHIIGLGFLAGVGFTMSLFIAQLAFGESALLAPSKIGILVGSVLAGVIGVTVLRTARSQREWAS
ncbi:MAG TPA: Na+/H+ antiporter NhaA [Armatimonadota bacterium]|nr:Na+/H+ antiporter NhaA [Armatimonadota bacterium]